MLLSLSVTAPLYTIGRGDRIARGCSASQAAYERGDDHDAAVRGAGLLSCSDERLAARPNRLLDPERAWQDSNLRHTAPETVATHL